MDLISSADFQRNVGRYQDRALVEPVIVTRNGRERLVLLSVAEYRRLKRLDRQTMAASDLSDEDLAIIMNGRMSEAHDHFNNELSE